MSISCTFLICEFLMGNSLRLVLFGFFYVSFSIIYATIDHLV